MRLLIIVQAEDSVVAENQIQELTSDLGRLCLPVNIVSSYSGLTTDVEVVMISTKGNNQESLNPEQRKLLNQCDLAVSKLYHSIFDSFKVIKDRKKSVVRDITEASFYCMLGKYYAFDYVELTKNDCE